MYSCYVNKFPTKIIFVGHFKCDSGKMNLKCSYKISYYNCVLRDFLNHTSPYIISYDFYFLT